MTLWNPKSAALQSCLLQPSPPRAWRSHCRQPATPTPTHCPDHPPLPPPRPPTLPPPPPSPQIMKDSMHKAGAAPDMLAASLNQSVQHPKDFVVSPPAGREGGGRQRGGGGERGREGGRLLGDWEARRQAGDGHCDTAGGAAPGAAPELAVGAHTRAKMAPWGGSGVLAGGPSIPAHPPAPSLARSCAPGGPRRRTPFATSCASTTSCAR